MTDAARPLRIPPLPPADRDEKANELLAPIAVNGRVLNIFATFVRHPRLFNRWSKFGGTLLQRGELSHRGRRRAVDAPVTERGDSLRSRTLYRVSGASRSGIPSGLETRSRLGTLHRHG